MENKRPPTSADVDAVVQSRINDMYGFDPSNDDYKRTASNNAATIDKDLVPYTVLVAKLANNVVSQRPLKVLLDSGSTSDFIYRSCLPTACKPTKLDTPINVSLLNAQSAVDTAVILEDVVLSEFSLTRHIDCLQCYVANGQSNYDMIIGCKTMKQLGI